LDEFVGPAAEARLQDLSWLGPRVCRHEAVIEQAMSRAAVLPARFATLFTTLESLESYVLERREAIAGFFAQLGDRQEWAVKGLLDRATALEGALRKLSKPRRWRIVRRGALLRAEAHQSPGGAGVQSAAAGALPADGLGLSATAGGFRERKAMPPEEGGAEAVLNWAFLLAPAEIAEFRALWTGSRATRFFPACSWR